VVCGKEIETGQGAQRLDPPIAKMDFEFNLRAFPYIRREEPETPQGKVDTAPETQRPFPPATGNPRIGAVKNYGCHQSQVNEGQEINASPKQGPVPPAPTTWFQPMPGSRRFSEDFADPAHKLNRLLVFRHDRVEALHFLLAQLSLKFLERHRPFVAHHDVVIDEEGSGSGSGPSGLLNAGQRQFL
jgi:hypothetical protein